MIRTPTGAKREGFTIIEMMIAVLVFGVVMAVAFSFLTEQNRGYRKGTEWLSVLQTLRYSTLSLEQDLRTAGTNLSPGQPELVYADEEVIAFNADYASNVENDIFAVYFDPDAPTGQVTSIRTEITIPQSAFRYPDTVYTTPGGFPSPGELLIFFFASDLSTARIDDYALYRQVNSGEAELVARGLLKSEAKKKGEFTPFFRYYRTNSIEVDSFPPDALPMGHTATIHLGPADTGSVARIDSINAVRITMSATNGLEGELERSYGVTRVIRLPNLGSKMIMVCGSRPILDVGLSASVVTLGGGERAVELAWDPAIDEVRGEGDVVRYVIYRQEGAGGSDWGDPFLSIPAGQATYTYQDADVSPGMTYLYGLGAQDCTPQTSDLATSASMTIPVG